MSLLLSCALELFWGFVQRIAGEIKSFSSEGWVAPKLSKRMDKFMLYLLSAGKKALADGGITEEVQQELDKAKCGVLIGSAMGGMKVFSSTLSTIICSDDFVKAVIIILHLLHNLV